MLFFTPARPGGEARRSPGEAVFCRCMCKILARKGVVGSTYGHPVKLFLLHLKHLLGGKERTCMRGCMYVRRTSTRARSVQAQLSS